jgi:hypothetical protein
MWPCASPWPTSSSRCAYSATWSSGSTTKELRLPTFAPDRAALRRHWARAAMPPHVGGEMRPTDVGRIRVYNAANSETIRCPESTSFACF